MLKSNPRWAEQAFRNKPKLESGWSKTAEEHIGFHSDTTMGAMLAIKGYPFHQQGTGSFQDFCILVPVSAPAHISTSLEQNHHNQGCLNDQGSTQCIAQCITEVNSRSKMVDQIDYLQAFVISVSRYLSDFFFSIVFPLLRPASADTPLMLSWSTLDLLVPAWNQNLINLRQSEVWMENPGVMVLMLLRWSRCTLCSFHTVHSLLLW